MLSLFSLTNKEIVFLLLLTVFACGTFVSDVAAEIVRTENHSSQSTEGTVQRGRVRATTSFSNADREEQKKKIMVRKIMRGLKNNAGTVMRNVN